jgi:hypothetical protein
MSWHRTPKTAALHLNLGEAKRYCECVRGAGSCCARVGLRERQAGRGYDPCHAQYFLIFDVGDRRDDQANVFQEFHFAQGRILAQFGERDLPRKALERAQVGDHCFALRIVRIRIGIARDFRERVQRSLRRGVVTEHAIALPYQFELAQGIGSCSRAAPHLFSFHEERVPMVVVWVHAE